MGPTKPASGLRALRAIVIALLVGVLGLASVGFAGEPTTELLTLTTSEEVRFLMPSPHVGDKASYDLTWDTGFPSGGGGHGSHGGHGHHDGGHGDGGHHDGGHGDGGHGDGGHGDGGHDPKAKSLQTAGGGHHGDDHGHHPPSGSTYSFEWLETGEIYDRAGAHHYTNRLAYRTEEMLSQRQMFASILELDQASRAVVGITQATQMGLGYSTAITGSSSATTTSSNWTTVLDPSEDPMPAADVPCVVFNPLQGVQRNLSSPVTVAGHCSVTLAFNQHLARPGIYVLDGVGTEDDVRFVRLVRDPVASGDTEQPTGVVVSAYTFREDMPYPAKMQVTDLETQKNGTWELNAFVRGDRPLGMSASTQPPLPPLVMVPVPDWGMDDTGVDHPYPLGAAWQDALVDPRTGLRLFLEQHDDVYVSYAQFEEIERDAGREHAWRFIATDGDDHLTVCQARDAATLADATTLPATSVQANTNCPQFELAQPDDHSPTLRPSALSLQTTWGFLQDLLDTDEPPLAYGFTAHDVGLPTAYETYTIGTAYRYGKEVEPAFGSVSPYAVQEGGAQVRFSADGRLEAYSVHVEERQYGPAEDEGGALAAHPNPGPASSTKTIQRLIPAAFTPTAGEASAVGGMALGAAALYWLWPWLKQVLLAPLFSRIAKPKVLDQERRQRVAAAVAAEPGIHFEELGRRLDMGRGTLRHHLQMLVQNDVVGVRKTGGYTCYYPKGEVDVRDVDAQAAARSPTAQQVLEAWQADPSLSGSDLAERLGLSRQTVHYHQKRLRAAGLMQ